MACMTASQTVHCFQEISVSGAVGSRRWVKDKVINTTPMKKTATSIAAVSQGAPPLAWHGANHQSKYDSVFRDRGTRCPEDGDGVYVSWQVIKQREAAFVILRIFVRGSLLFFGNQSRRMRNRISKGKKEQAWLCGSNTAIHTP